MCGICGQIATSQASHVNQEPVQAMMEKLIHRGPDSKGLYHNHKACIGMRRLSLVDLSGGNQPILNEDGSLAIVMNGEIYNYKEIRQNLKSAHCFKSNSDTEVVLHLFEEDGPSAFEKLEGMFAIAILEVTTGHTWIARDRFGIKPLYWIESKGILSFSSELVSLCAGVSVPRKISEAGLSEYLTFGYVRGNQSILAGVNRLSPGKYLDISLDRTEEKSFWNKRKLLLGNEISDEKEAIKQLENLLYLIIPSYQAADVPVAAFLSGGIDSSLVCRYMKGEECATYSMAFRNSSFHDESPFAKKVASILGTHHTAISLEYPDLDTILKVISCFGEPFADSSAIPTFMVSKEISKHVKAALSGDGADEIFMGYSLYQGTALSKYLSLLPLRKTTAKTLRKASSMGTSRSEALDTIARRLEHSLQPVNQQVLSKLSMFSKESKSAMSCFSSSTLNTIARQPVYYDHIGILNDTSISLLKRISYMQLVLNLPSGILTKVDRSAMAASLEVRIPFLDSRIVNFAFNLSDNLKLHRHKTKYILRSLASKYYPKSISGRPKHGFTVPLLQWFAGSLGDYLLNVMSDSAAGDTGLINPTEVTETIKRHQSNKENASSTLYAILVLEEWARRWL